jgi:DMSO/TMAO reductase YedYZ heme-binding membrane subunit
MISIDLKKWLWILTVPTLLVLLVLGILQAGEPAGFSAITATILLTCTLIPSAMLRLNILKSNPWVRWLVKYRKDIGIVTGTWFLTHGLVSALFFLHRDQPILDQFFVPALRPVWIMVPIMALMLITSNEYSEKKLGKLWRNLHSLVWVLPGLMIYHGNLSIAEFEKEDFAPAVLILLAVALFAIYESIRTRSFRRVLLLLLGFALAQVFWFTNPTA